MKKKWMSILIFCAISFSSLYGCTKDDSAVQKLTLDGKDIVLKIGETNYSADDLFLDLLDTTNGGEVAYSKILKLVVQTAMPVDANMKAGLELQFETWENSVKEYANTNSLKYSEAEKAKLTEAGVDTVEELKDLYAYQAQLKKLKTVYWKDNKGSYLDKYIEERLLYYVRHILVNVSKSDTNQDLYYTTIDSTTAEKLYRVYDMIVEGKSFYSVAYLLPSDDSGSVSDGGAYKMDITTSFVNEFKYGVIAFDAYSRGVETLDDVFGLPGELNDLYGDGFDSVPASYFIKLNEVKENSSGLFPTPNSSGPMTYPRNIIFNSLFNTPGISLITYDLELGENEEYPANTCEVDFVKGSEGLTRVLCDEKGNPIFFTRGTYGIHFLVIEKSPFELDDAKKFFSMNPDKDDEYTSYVELEETVAKQNDVKDELESLAKSFAERGITDSSEVAGQAKFVDFDMFEFYLNKDYDGKMIEIVNPLVEDAINDYIYSQRQKKDAAYASVINSQWTSYVDKLAASKSEFASKRRPPLVCLEYTNENKNCKYTYENGFEVINLGEGQ